MKTNRETKMLLENRKERYKEIDVSYFDKLTDIVSKVFNVKKENITGRRRYREYTEARQTIMYLAVNKPLWLIGAYLGWIDHSTVIAGRKIVKETLMKDKEYLIKFNEVKRIISEGENNIKEQIETIEDLNTLI